MALKNVQFGEEVSMHGKATWISKDGEERCLLSLGNDAIQARFPFGESESPQDKVFSIWFANVYGVKNDGAKLTVHCYVPKSRDPSKGDPLAGVSTKAGFFSQYTFLLDDAGEALEWLSRVQRALQAAGELPTSARYLVIINPYGGAKNGRKVFDTMVAPMFATAGLQFETLLTTHHGHGIELGRELQLDTFEAVVCVSGDGLLHELINGLLSRDDWAAAIQIPLAIIAGGTGNAVAKSLDMDDPRAAAFAIIKGAHRPLDLFAMTQGNETIYSHLSLTYGLVADIDIKSEVFRFMGSSRFTMSAVVEVIAARSYKFRIATYAKSKREAGDAATVPHTDDTASTHRGPPLRWRGLDMNSLPDGWVVEDLKARGIVAVNVPWLSLSTCAAPSASPSDGLLDLVIIKKGGFGETVKMLLSLEDMTIDSSPIADYRQCEAIIFEPPNDKDILAVDGERVPCKTTIVEILPQIGRIICPRDLPPPRPFGTAAKSH